MTYIIASLRECSRSAKGYQSTAGCSVHCQLETTERYAHLDHDTVGKSAERDAVRSAKYILEAISFLRHNGTE